MAIRIDSENPMLINNIQNISPRPNTALKVVLALIFLIIPRYVFAAPLDDFITTWKTDNDGSSSDTSITIPTIAGGYSYQVDWNNDGDFLDADETEVNTGSITHDFGTAGTYTIRIKGDFPRIYFNNVGDKSKILSLDQWGTGAWTSMENAFYGAENLVIPATDIPNFSSTTNMAHMFADATFANPVTSLWDVSKVTNMSSMFESATVANPDTSNWNVSNVTDMKFMFYDATSANPDTSNWNVSNVTNMSSMFEFTTVATPDTRDWIVSSVIDMRYMFASATSANPDTSKWNVSNVTTMNSMFADTTSANPDTSNWKVSSVTDMGFMFSGATAANPNTIDWDVSNVLDMQSMFEFTTAANPDTSKWNASSVTTMNSMFADTNSANPDTSAWVVSSVTDMGFMFSGATAANPNTSGWNVTNVFDMQSMFEFTTAANPDTISWDVSNVINMRFMFSHAESANPNTSNWDISSVNDMTAMFTGVRLPTARYDTLLRDFDAQTLTNPVTFDAGNSTYCFSANERANLMSNDNWNITDGGQNCDYLLVEALEDSVSNGGSNNSNGVAITALELSVINGITNVLPANEALYQSVIAKETDFSNPPTSVEVQTLIDSVNALAEVLEDSGSTGGADNANSSLITTTQLAEITGITNVLTGNEALYQSAIAKETGFSNPPTTVEVQTLIDSVNALAEVLEDSGSTGGADNANSTLVTTTQLAAITDITNVLTANEALYQTAIVDEAGFSNPPTTVEVQTLIDSVNALAEVLEDSDSTGGADNANSTLVTTTQLAAITDITNVLTANEALYQSAIAKETGFSNPPTTVEVQTLIDSVNALAEVLEDSDSTGGADNANSTLVTTTQLAAITDITNVLTANEVLYQSAVAKETDFSNPPTTVEVQTLIDSVNALAEVLEDSDSTGGADNANSTLVTTTQLAAITDITNVLTANEALYQSAIAKETGFSNPPTTVEVQTLIDSVNALAEVLEDSDSTGGADNANSTLVTTTQLAEITGITNVLTANEALYQTVIVDETGFSNPPTTVEVQTLIDSVNALAEVLEDSGSTGGADNANSTLVTTTQLAAITDITNVLTANEALYQTAIVDEAGFSNPPTTVEVQTLIDSVNALAEVLEDSGSTGGADNANSTLVTTTQLAAITDITNVLTANEALYQSAIAKETDFSNPPTTVEVQTLIDSVNALAEVLEDSDSTGGADNANSILVTTTQLAAITDITNVLTANEALYQSAIAKETGFSNPPTTVEVQTLIDSVNALAEVLEDSGSTGGADNANSTLVTTTQLAAITDITNVLTANEVLYQSAVAKETDFSNPPTTVEVQTLIDSVNALAEVLEDSDSTGGADNANSTLVTTTQLAAITDITNVLTANEALYQSAIAKETGFSNPPTTVEVQTLIDSVNALAEVLEDSDSTGGADNANSTLVTTTQLAAITDITNVLTANEALYQSAIAKETGFSNPPTTVEVQTLIDSVNALAEVLEDSGSTGGADNANSTLVTTTQLAAITDITNVLTANEVLYQSAVAKETDFSNPPTTVEVQTLIDSVNALAEVLEDSDSTGGADNANSILVTTTQLAAITDITNVLTANEALYQSAITKETGFSNPPTTVEVQTLIDSVNALAEVLEDSDSTGGADNANSTLVTTTQLAAITDITNVLTANEALYQSAIAKETGFSNPPTTVEVQTLIDSVNALAEVLEDSGSTGGADNANSTLVTTTQLAAITDITNVLTANEALYQSAIAKETDFSNPPTTVEVQTLIDSVNALAEVLEDSDSTGGADNANSTLVTTTQLAAIIDITNVLTANEALYQSAIAKETGFSNPPTTVEVQTLIDSVNALAEVLEDSDSTGGADNANSTLVTTTQLAAITDITNVLTANEALYQSAIAKETGLSNPPTTVEVQTLIDSVNALAEVLEDSGSTGGADNANSTLVTTTQLAAITDITNVLTANEALYQSAIAKETGFSNPPTTVEVQTLIDSVNALAEVLEDSDSTGGADNANSTLVTTTQLAAITDITNVLTANEALYQTVIVDETGFSNPPTTVEVQTLIDSVNALAEVLEDSGSTGGADNANSTLVTTTQLTAITDITNVLTANEVLYQSAVAKETDFSNPPTTVEVQTLIDSVNALAEVLEDSDSTGGADNANSILVTTTQLAAITDITNVLTANEVLYQSAVAKETDFSNPPTTVEVQTLIDSVNALAEVLEDSGSTGGADNANSTLVTTTQLAEITGITNVLTANEALYQTVIVDETGFSNPPTTVEVQTLIDSVNALAEVLEDSGSTGGADNANSTLVTTTQLAAITDITNVLTANEALYQSAIAKETGFSNPPTTVEVQTLIDSVNVLAEVLEDSGSTGGADNANSTLVTTTQLAAITDITNVLTANEALYQTAIVDETGFSNPPTTVEVQTLIDSVNALAEVLEDSGSTGGARNANSSLVTTTQLAEITGITNVLTANEALYQTAIAKETGFSNPPTTDEVQTLIDTVNALAEVLEDSGSTGGARNANSSLVTTTQLAEITGITNVLEANEALYQTAIAKETGFSNPPTTVEVQTLIDSVNTLAEVLEDSVSTGGADNANSTPVTTTQLATITDITNVLTANEALYQTAIAKVNGFSSPPTVSEVQSIIDSVNKSVESLTEVLEDSDSIGGANNANSSLITTTQLATIIDITNVLTANEALYQSAIDKETGFSNPPTTVEVQTLIDSVNALAEVLEDSGSTGGADNANSTLVTTTQLAAITDITNVLTANEALYQTAIVDETGFSNPPTTVEVQTLIDTVNALAEVLEDSGSTGGARNANSSLVTTTQLAEITGITNVLTANEALYQTAIAKETGFSNPPTTVEVQTLIDSVNALAEVLEDSGSTGGADNANSTLVTTTQLAAITDITNVLTANEALYQTAIVDEAGFSNPPTTVEVQTLIDSVNALAEVLEDSDSTGGADNANSTLVTTTQLAAITDITNVLTANEALYQSAIAKETGFSNPPTTVEVQTLIDSVNALAEVLEDSDSTGGADNANSTLVTTTQLAAITDITNVLTANEVLYQSAVAKETDFSNPPTTVEVQTLIDSVNALAEVLEDSDSTGGADNANSTLVTTTQLAAITDITNVLTANEALYQSAIAKETGFSNPPTTVEVQTLIDSVNALAEVLEDSDSTGGADNANSTLVTTTQLAEITGITNVLTANEALYQTAIAKETGFSNPPTTVEVQTLIDTVNALAEVLEDSGSTGGADNANSTLVTTTQLAAITDITNVLTANEALYQSAIAKETGFSNPPTTVELQTLIDSVNALAEVLEDSDSTGGADNANSILVTTTQLAAITDITNVLTANEALYQSAIAKETGFSNPPTTVEVQTLIDSVNALAEVLEDSGSTGGTDNANSTLVTTTQLAAITDITNVLTANEALYQTAIVDETGFSNPPTTVEVQTLIDSVNALAEVLEDSGSTGGSDNANSTPVTTTQLAAITDITNVLTANEALYQTAIAKETGFSNPPTTVEVQTLIDSVNALAEVLEDSGSTGGADNANSTLVTTTQLAAITDITNVLTANEALYQTAIVDETGLSNPPTTVEVQTLIDSVNALAEVLEDSGSTGGADNANSTLVTTTQLAAITDITNVLTANEALYQTTIVDEAGFSNPPTTVEVQTLIDSVNALAEVLEDSGSTGGAGNANASPVTTTQLAAVTGITNVLTANELLYQADIAKETDFSSPPTVSEVQSIIDAVNASVESLTEVLEDSDSIGGANNANSTLVTTTQLAAITDITNVLTANEALYQAAIAKESDFSNPPTTVEVQTFIDSVNANVSALAEVLEDSGSTGGAGNANSTLVTTTQLAAITDITNVLTANEALYQAAIAKESAFSNPPTTVEVQSLIDTVNANVSALAEVLEDSGSTGGADNANSTLVTTTQLASITDITNVLTANEALYQAAIAKETGFSNPPTTVEVQTLIDTVNALAEVLEDSGSTGGAGNANSTLVTTTQLAAITDITNVLTANEALYQTAIAKETGFSNPPTTVEVQTLIDTVNALAEVLEDSGSTGGAGNANSSPVTTTQLAAITGITNVLTANELIYQAAIAKETDFSSPPTVSEVLSIIDTVNASVKSLTEVLEDSDSIGGANNANSTLVTTIQLAAITDITNVLTANEALYQTAIAKETDFSNPPTTVEVQTLIDTLNANVSALVEVLEYSGSTGGTGNLNASAVTTAELSAIIGITGVQSANEALYQAAIASESGFSNPPTVSEVQSIIDSVNASVESLTEVLEDSNSVNGSNNENANPITSIELKRIIGITDVIFANEVQYQAAISSETGFSNPPTPLEVQKIINAVNTDVAVLAESLEDSASTQGQNNANGVAITAIELATITGITAVDYANESLYQHAIASEKDFSQPPTLTQIQAIIDSVNTQVIAMNLAISLALSELLETSASPGGGNANQQGVTVEQLELIAEAIDPTLINQYNLAIESATTLSSPPTIAQVQTIIDSVNQVSSAIDTDGDGINNDFDTDDDNDGYTDIIEIANGSDPLNVNSVPDYIDTDGDTIVDSIERNQDTDKDGVPDILDLDSDNDGLYDIIEAAVDPTEVYLLDADNDGRVDSVTPIHVSAQVNEIVDTDGDSVADFRDLDSDNDGLLDRDERYEPSIQTNPVNSLYPKDQTSINNNGALANIIHAPEDHDQDGIINSRDLDSDNDGIVDTIEAGNKDEDNNGIIDAFTDNDLNGVDDAVFSTLIVTTDTDNDGLQDFLDLDSDQDGLSDLQETDGIDENLDGKVDLFVDFNADGWTDLGQTQPVQLVDSDNDGVEDFRNSDSDSDGITDAAEIGHIDADNDGVIDALTDIDHDNIPDSVDVDQTSGVDSDDDGIDDRFGASTNTQIDTDGDGISDEFDHDPNGDGWVVFEGTPTSAAALPDADGDGKPDVTDAIHNEDVVHVSVSGGGCTVTSNRGFDPLFLLILCTSLLYFRKRNRNDGQKRTTTTLSIVLLGGLLLSMTVEAGQKKAYLGVGGGISKLEPTIEGNRYRLDDTTGTTSHFLLGYRFKQDWALELEYADLGRATMKPSATVDYNVTSANGLYQLWQAQKAPVSIFGRVGVGAISSHSSTLVVEKDHNMLWLFGAGIETDINHLLTLRADAVNFDRDARRFSVSLLYNFAEPTPAQAKFNRNVMNKKTQPVEVERVDFQLQSNDDLQEQNALVAASSVYFEFDTQEATPEQYRKLVAILHWMQADSRRTITISGHSDNIGNEEFNLQLSKERAQSVSDYFSSHGVSKTRMILLYLGESDPVASNSSEEGRRLNRRVNTEPNIE